MSRYGKFSIDGITAIGTVVEEYDDRVTVTTGQLVLDLPRENVRIIPRPEQGDIMRLGEQRVLIVSTDGQGRVLVQLENGDRSMTCIDQLSENNTVYLVHRQGVEKGTVDDNGRVLRKGRFEKWDRDRVFDNETDAYRALMNRQFAQIDKIYDRLDRIAEKVGV